MADINKLSMLTVDASVEWNTAAINATQEGKKTVFYIYVRIALTNER